MLVATSTTTNGNCPVPTLIPGPSPTGRRARDEGDLRTNDVLEIDVLPACLKI